MDDMNSTRPKLHKGVVEQWVKTISELPQQQPPEKTKKEKKKDRWEWLELLLCLFSLVFSIYLVYLNITSSVSSMFLRFITLFHPLAIFLLYHLRILEPNSTSGNQGIACLLFLSSFCALFTAIQTLHIQFPDILSFVLPALICGLVVLAFNHFHRKRRKRYLSWMIMLVWLPFYMPAFVMLSSITFPSLPAATKNAIISRTTYDGEGSYRVLLHLQDSAQMIECRITKQESKAMQSGDTIVITEKLSWLGIRYFEIYPNM